MDSEEPLLKGEVLFAHLSSNLNGDLLVQSGGFQPGSDQALLLQANGKRQRLALKPPGRCNCCPLEEVLWMPSTDGLSLRPLKATKQEPQMLPGSRELGAFCGASGRAVLIRHWPDYRRSIELVIPGKAPKQLHLGDQAVLGVACDNRGERMGCAGSLGAATRQSRTGADQCQEGSDKAQSPRAVDAQGRQPHPMERGDKPVIDDTDATKPNPCPRSPDRRRQLADRQGDQRSDQRSAMA